MNGRGPGVPKHAVTRPNGSMGAFLDSWKDLKVGMAVRSKPTVRGSVSASGQTVLGVIQSIFWEKEKGQQPHVRVKVKRHGTSRGARGAYYPAEMWEPFVS